MVTTRISTLLIIIFDLFVRLFSFQRVNCFHRGSFNINARYIFVSTKRVCTIHQSPKKAQINCNANQNDDIDWTSIPQFADNLPSKTYSSNITLSTTSNSKTKFIKQPNADWRAAMSKPSKKTVVSQITKNFKDISSDADLRSMSTTTKRIPTMNSRNQNDLSDIDFDYADFELAMYEEESSNGLGSNINYGAKQGLNQGRAVSSRPIISQEPFSGLETSDVLEKGIWNDLIDGQGNKYDYLRIGQMNPSYDVVIVISDPRRYTDEFRIILDEFKRIPIATLKASLLAVNCDDPNDLRKMMKKVSLPFPFLVDPSKKFMDSMRCRAVKSFRSALFMLDIKTAAVLNIWYEGDWDEFTTKDMITEELKAYRRNPKAYLESQLR